MLTHSCTCTCTGGACVGLVTRGLHRLILHPDLVGRSLRRLTVREAAVDVFADPGQLSDGVADVVRAGGVELLAGDLNAPNLLLNVHGLPLLERINIGVVAQPGDADRPAATGQALADARAEVTYVNGQKYPRSHKTR